MKETITITREEYDNVVSRVIKLGVNKVNEMNNENPNPVAALIIPMVGITYMADLRNMLFEDEEEKAKREEQESEHSVESTGFRSSENGDSTRIDPISPFDLFGDM